MESARELATQRGHRNEAIRAENEDLKADLAEKDQEIAALKACIQAEPQSLPTYTSPFPELQSKQPSHSQPTPTYTSPYVQTQPQQAFYSEPAPTYFSPYPQEWSPHSEPFYSFGHRAQNPAPTFNYEAREAYSEPPQAVGTELPEHADSEAPQKEDSEPPQRVYSKLPRRAVYAEPSKPVYSEPPPPEPEAAKPKSSERDAEIFDGGRAIEEEAARAKAARAAEKAAADAMVAAKQEALKAQLATEALSGFADTAAPPPEFSAPSSARAVVRKRMSARERAARKAIGRPRRK